MSYFAFLCRAAVSATSFTVIGNVCKILTVLINVSIWDKHASPEGLGALLLCLGAAAAYQQSPLRKDAGVQERTSMPPASCALPPGMPRLCYGSARLLTSHALSGTCCVPMLFCHRYDCHENASGKL